ncbi:MAG: hypothetical protein K9J43_01040 [Polynucleobacter sp.]|nr:hypothetical protein [Polynucleobacter sp.]
MSLVIRFGQIIPNGHLFGLRLGASVATTQISGSYKEVAQQNRTAPDEKRESPTVPNEHQGFGFRERRNTAMRMESAMSLTRMAAMAPKNILKCRRWRDGEGWCERLMEQLGAIGNRGLSPIVPIVIVLLTLTFFGASPSWAKGPLDGDASTFGKQTLSPILIREKLCTSVQDCREREYFFCTSWESISCDLYGITDEKIIKEILLAMLNSGLKASHFRFWLRSHRDKSFFDKPILEFIDHTGGK